MSNTAGCRLCSSPAFDLVACEAVGEQLYRIGKCRECGLVYIPDTFDGVSPAYTKLALEDLDEEHLWRQTKHKEAAFQQCLGLVSSGLDRELSSASSVLDVGCGVGGWLRFVREHTGASCYGFDASLSQVALAQADFPAVRCATSIRDYRAQLSDRLPRFDLITLWDVLEHIRQPVNFLGEIRDALKPGGTLFVSVPAATPMLIKQRLLSFGWPRSRFSWAPHEHVAYYSPRTLRHLLMYAGLRVERVGSVVAYPRPISPFEMARRAAFRLSAALPGIAPQVYALASLPSEATAASRPANGPS